MAPTTELEQARRLWNQYQPQGRFDAVVNLESQQRGPSRLRVDVVPRQIELNIDGYHVEFSHTGGAFGISDAAVSAQGLVFDVTTDSRKDGKVALDGSYGLSGEKSEALALSGSWLIQPFSTKLVWIISSQFFQ